MEHYRLCRTCNVKSLESNFYRDKNRTDGLRVQCKPCVKARLRAIPINRVGKAKATKKWSDKNREHVRQKSRESKQNNPERTLNYIHKRNALKRGNGVFKIQAKELKRIKNSKCFYCSSVDNITFDHVVPLSKGGRHSIGNLLPACMKCNTSKGNKFLIEFLQYRKAVHEDVASGSKDSNGEPNRG